MLLVDFDAVGLDGEARYSACLTPDAGYCSRVARGQIMKKDHDLGNPENLLEAHFMKIFAEGLYV